MEDSEDGCVCCVREGGEEEEEESNEDTWDVAAIVHRVCGGTKRPVYSVMVKVDRVVADDEDRVDRI